jgi:hypothetical protein
VSEDTVRAIIIALLGTGGATFIWTLARSILAWRNSAEGREDKAVGRLAAFEEDCRSQLAFERKWGAYWSRRSAVLERVIVLRLGVEEVPAPEQEHTQEDL